MSTITLTVAVLILTIALILDSHRKKRGTPSYPPGPKPRFFVGNLFDVPAIKPWKVYREWGKVYGDLIHLNVKGQHIIIVNSQKRWMAVNAGLMRYGQIWRMHRRVFTQGFRAAVVPNYQSILSSKTSQFLTSLRQTPDAFVTHIKTYAGASILATIYGHDIESSQDQLVDLVEETVGTLSDALQPTTTLILSVLPFLRHVSLELPVFSFQRVARRTRRLLDKMRTVPYEIVMNNTAMEKGKFSLLGELLEHYKAGVETTLSSVVTFFLAMAIHPEIQKRAQNELDTVVGRDQLPTYADRSNLPFVEAILRETLRWSPALPLGVSHAAFTDDIVGSYYIPKGASIVGNIWAMTRDEAIYPNPESFKPERFLTKDGTCNDDQMLLPFGFGRRICAGRHFALLTVWMTMASVLLYFDIKQPEDKTGKPIKCLADINYSDGLFSHADHFRCVIKPRVDRYTGG
ncbi:cytochrome P450 [Marasmius fiardii PR-910]|nr:cytochrome P450 [Marasmius fiardii PR-910]